MDLLAEHLRFMLSEELEIETDTLELFNESYNSPVEDTFVIPDKNIKFKKESKIRKLKEDMDRFLGIEVNKKNPYKMDYEYKKDEDGKDYFYFSIIKII